MSIHLRFVIGPNIEHFYTRFCYSPSGCLTGPHDSNCVRLEAVTDGQGDFLKKCSPGTALETPELASFHHFSQNIAQSHDWDDSA